MIYTITTNPSLDYYLKINDLQRNEINRSDEEYYDAAGKGVNVSKILDDLGISTITLGFLGGFPKEYYLDLLTKFTLIQPQFTIIKDNTRINVKVDSENETSLNAKGPSITKEEFERFLARLDSIYDNDYVVISGNVQEELKEGMLKAVKKLIDNGVKVILDTDEEFDKEAAKFKPFLIKATYTDIGTNEETIIDVGTNCVKEGTKYFLYSAVGMPSYLFTKDGYYVCDISKNDFDSSIGTNDSMIAGFLFALLKAASPLEAFTYANAVTLTAHLLDDNIDLGLVNKNYKELEVKRFDYK